MNETEKDAERPKKIGLRFPSWCGYGPTITRGILSRIREGLSWKLIGHYPSHGEMEVIEVGADWEGDGVILFRASEEELASYRDRGIPAVIMSSEGPALDFPRVFVNGEKIGRMAFQHLAECQLKHFAFLGRGETLYQENNFGSGWRRYSRDRLAGFRGAVEEHGFELISNHLRGYPLWEKDAWQQIDKDVKAILLTLPKPCGLFVVDDSLSAVVSLAAADLGIRIPQDLALVGFGNDANYCLLCSPPLSSLRYPGEKVGYRAAELLEAQFKGEEVPAESQIDPEPVEARESTDLINIDDTELVRIVRWVRKRAMFKMVQVSDLADMSEYSASTIKARFQKHLGHSPKKEITMVRVMHLKYLLRKSDQPLSEIADMMDFASANELSRFFQREVGMRPGEYREGVD